MGTLVCALTLAVVVRTGLQGRDFGFHWDEGLHMAAVQKSVETGSLLPERYLYPSLTHLALMAYTAPRIWNHSRAQALEQTRGEAFKLGARGYLFLLSLSALAALWVLARQLGFSVGTAVLAVCLLASAWEFVYHARWIAPDMLLAPFALIAIALLLRALQTRRTGWLIASSLAAGFCCGVKYPGGLLLFNTWFALWLYRRQIGSRMAWKWAAISFFSFALSYFISTPGTLLEPTAFLHDLHIQVSVYSSGHFGYSLPAGPVHLWRMLCYLARAALSPYPLLAALVAGFALYGIIEDARRDPRRTATVLFFPVGWLLFFCLLKVMIVRNFQVTVPFVALFAARGFFLLARDVAQPRWRAAVFAAGFMVVGANLWWLLQASVPPVAVGAQARDLIQAHGAEGLWISPAVRAQLKKDGGPVPADAPQPTAYIFQIPSDLGKELHRLRANTVGRYQVSPRVPRDTNLDFYPTWTGQDRPVLLTAEQAAKDDVIQVLRSAQERN